MSESKVTPGAARAWAELLADDVTLKTVIELGALEARANYRAPNGTLYDLRLVWVATPHVPDASEQALLEQGDAELRRMFKQDGDNGKGDKRGEG